MFDHQRICFSGHMVHALPLKLSTQINFESYLQGKLNESGHRKWSPGQHGVPHGTKPDNHGYSLINDGDP